MDLPRKLLFLTLALPLCTAYAEAPPRDLFALSLEELTHIKITGSTLTGETLKSVPSSVSVYSHEQIAALGIDRLEDLMNLVPGYQANRTDAFGLSHAYSSRGRRLGSSGPEVLILMDGQRLNNDWNGGANLEDAAIPLENVERVEFIRGPGSTIYGSNAIMGVINIITRSDKEISVQAGSHQTRQATAQWNFGDDQRHLQVFTKTSTDGGEALSIYEPYSKTFIDSRDPSDTRDAYLRGQWDEFSASARMSERDSRDFYAVGFVDNAQNQVDTQSSFLNLGWKHSLNNNVVLDAQLSVSNRQYHVRSAALLSPYTLIDGGISEKEKGIKLLLQDDHGAQRWLLGWEFRQPELYDTLATINSTTALQQAPTTDRTIAGYFGQYQLAVTDNTDVILGARLDDYSDFGTHMSPRAGIIHQLDSDNTLKLLYAEAFRAPARIETSVMNSGAFVRNPYLAPEVTKTYELVWLYSLAQGQISSSLFHTAVDDAIYETAYGIGNMRTWKNGHESEAGLELELQQTLSTHWSTRIAITHIFDQPTDINSEATTLFGGSLVYQQGKWESSLRANYQGARRDSTETDSNPSTAEFADIGGRTVIGTHIGYQLFKNTELYLDANNLLDKHYVSAAVRYTNTEGVPERGRMLTIGLTWRFE